MSLLPPLSKREQKKRAAARLEESRQRAAGLLTATARASENPVSQPCGCVNLMGGEIRFCPLHAAAPALLAALKDAEALLKRYVDGDRAHGSIVLQVRQANVAAIRRAEP